MSVDYFFFFNSVNNIKCIVLFYMWSSFVCYYNRACNQHHLFIQQMFCEHQSLISCSLEFRQEDRQIRFKIMIDEIKEKPVFHAQ